MGSKRNRNHGANPVWDYAITTPNASAAALANLGQQGLPRARVLLLEGAPERWLAQVQEMLEAIAAAHTRPWVLLVWSGDFDVASLTLPPGLRLGVVTGADERWGVLLFDGGDDPPLASPLGFQLDSALDACRSKVRLLARRDALGGSAAQIQPDGVGLTGTSNPGSWASEPYALALKNMATPPVKIGDLVAYIDSGSNPGTVHGFAPGGEYWRWDSSAWPASFKITQTGGDSSVDKDTGTWLTLNEGAMAAAPSAPGGGSWYNIRASGDSTIIGFLWLNSETNPSSFRWYGKSTALTSGRFDTSSTTLEFVRRTDAPSIFTGFKMFIPQNPLAPPSSAPAGSRPK